MNVQIVAKALDDFGDDWHWVILHDAVQRSAHVYTAQRVDTVCGVVLDEQPINVTLYDTGAPEMPNCERCLGNVSPGLVTQIEEAMRTAETVPVGA